MTPQQYRNALTSVFSNLRNDRMRDAAYQALAVDPAILKHYIPYLPSDSMKERAHRLLRVTSCL